MAAKKEKMQVVSLLHPDVLGWIDNQDAANAMEDIFKILYKESSVSKSTRMSRLNKGMKVIEKLQSMFLNFDFIKFKNMCEWALTHDYWKKQFVSMQWLVKDYYDDLTNYERVLRSYNNYLEDLEWKNPVEVINKFIKSNFESLSEDECGVFLKDMLSVNKWLTGMEKKTRVIKWRTTNKFLIFLQFFCALYYGVSTNYEVSRREACRLYLYYINKKIEEGVFQDVPLFCFDVHSWIFYEYVDWINDDWSAPIISIRRMEKFLEKKGWV